MFNLDFYEKTLDIQGVTWIKKHIKVWLPTGALERGFLAKGKWCYKILREFEAIEAELPYKNPNHWLLPRPKLRQGNTEVVRSNKYLLFSHPDFLWYYWPNQIIGQTSRQHGWCTYMSKPPWAQHREGKGQEESFKESSKPT